MGYKVWLSNKAIGYIFSNGNEFLPNESGGILMGYQVSEEEFVVTNVIGPGPKAIHSRNSFQPDQKYHKKEISNYYKKSGRLETYLGDWHTHPNSIPYLSSKDKETLKAIANYPQARLPKPLMLVAAPPSREYKVWVFEKLSASKNKYTQVEEVISF